MHPPSGLLGPDRSELLDRLQRLRTIVPVFAQELTSARRQAAQLRIENRRLLEEVRRLQRERVSSGAATRPGARDSASPGR